MSRDPKTRKREPGEVPQGLTQVDRTPDELTPLQARFCDEFIIDLDASAAYRRARAGKELAGAKQLGHKMLKLPQVQERVRDLMTARSDRTGLTADRVLSEIDKLAHIDIGLLFDERNCFRPIAEIPENIRRAIASVEVDEIFEGRGDDRKLVGYTKKIRLWDKKGSLELQGRHLRLFTDRVEHSGTVRTLEEILTRSRET